MIAAKRGHFLLFQHPFVSPAQIFFRFQNKQTETKEGSEKRNKDSKRCRKVKIVIGSVCMERGFLYQRGLLQARFHSGRCLTPLIMRLCNKELYCRYHKRNLKRKVSAGFQNGAQRAFLKRKHNIIHFSRLAKH